MQKKTNQKQKRKEKGKYLFTELQDLVVSAAVCTTHSFFCKHPIPTDQQ